MEVITYTYFVPLVILSVIIAIMASYVALDLGVQVKKAKSFSKVAWLTAGAVTMGMGIWAMHFVAMLAYHLNIPVEYDYQIVIISILPAIISSGLALFIISKDKLVAMDMYLGGFFIATGIVSMHYTGMEAMMMDATVMYNPYLYALSVLIAFIASVVALYLISFVSNNYQSKSIWRRKLISSLIMGAAIAGMHYTGMAAANFTAHEHPANLPPIEPSNSSYMAYAITIVVVILLGLVFLSIMIDRRFENQTISSEKRFLSVMEAANDAIILADGTGTIISWNNGAQSIFGFSKQEIIGKPLATIIPENYHIAHWAGMKRYMSTRIEKVIGQTVELEGLQKDGSVFPIELSLAAWTENGTVFFSSIIRDITERKRNEEKINQMVYRDALTGLPNRLLLHDRLTLAIDQATHHHHSLGVMFIDLDRFKVINDTLGHATGDKLLIAVGQRLLSLVEKQDTVARQGGDEFIILLSDSSVTEVTRMAKTVIKALNLPFPIDGQELFITPSIGISMFPGDGKESEKLIKHADTAMYQVKEGGKNHFKFYTPEMNEAVSRKMMLEIGLRKALERKEFQIVYQPQIEVNSRKIIGTEALLRWHHPDLGPISPGEFIPIAEESGLIIPIGEYVLTEACKQNKAWQEMGYPPLRMAVNISSRQFQQSDLLYRVRDILEETQLDPHYLELELTETIIQDFKHAIDKMHQLKDMGIHLSIDDFGTGYSSLSYLKTFPIHTLKIDQSFTKNIYTDPKDASLVATIISMAHNLDLKVIAEGVETQEQLAFLQDKDCNEAQGYYFSRPIPAEEVERLLGINTI